MKKWFSRLKNWVCRMIVIVAMLLGIGGAAETALAQCEPDLDNQNVLRVDANTQADPQNQDGLSWDCAFEDLQDALDNIGGSFDTIWIAEGTYIPTNEVDIGNSGGVQQRRRTFEIPTGISVYGGFPQGGGNGSFEARDPSLYTTTLSGLINSPNPGDKSYHVVLIIGEASGDLNSVRIEGVTITNGYADGPNYHAAGGGVHLLDGTEGYSATPRFTDCIFTNNYADDAGGAMLSRKAGAVLRDCVFRENATGGYGVDEYEGGGAVAAYGPLHVIKSKFVMNASETNSGGAISNLGNSKLVNSEFYGNSAEIAGAVITGTGVTVNCVFAGNQATDGSAGGAISKTSAKIINCEFCGNMVTTANGQPVPCH